MDDISYGEVCLDAPANYEGVAQHPPMDPDQAIDVAISVYQTDVKATKKSWMT